MYHFVVLCTFSLVAVAYSATLAAPTHLLVTRVGPCYDQTKVSINISEMSLSRKLYESSMSGKLNISQDVKNGWNVKATMQKCHDIRNLDTCDYFKSFSVIRSGCDDEDPDDEDLYTMFFHYVQPRLQCPLEAGRYKISNFPFFTEDSDLTVAEAKISTSVFGYTYRLEGFDVNYKKILCVDAFLQLLYVREHDWVGGRRRGGSNGSVTESARDSEQTNEENVDSEE